MAQRSTARSLDVTTGSIWRQLLTLFAPAFLCVILQELCAFCDLSFISQHVQPRAFEAVRLVAGIAHVIITLAVGMSVGCSIIVSHHFGAHSGRRLKQTTHTAIALSILVGILVSALGIPSLNPALRAYGLPNELMSEASAFAYAYLGAAVLIFLFNMATGLQRAVGDVRSPIYAVVLLCLSNVGLSALFVGYLDWGARGAAYATAGAYLVGTVAAVLALMRVRAPWRLSLRHIRIHPPIARDMRACALPLMLQGLLFTLTNFIVQWQMGSFGAQMAEAWRISVRIGTVVWMVADAFAIGTITFSAQNFGAGNYRRMKRGLHVAVLLSVVLVGCVAAVGSYFSSQISALFSNDRVVTDLAATIVMLSVPFYLIFAWTDDIAAIIRGSGEGFWPMVIFVLGTCVVRVAWMLVAVPRSNSIITAVVSYPIAWLVTALAFVVYYRHGQWITRSLRRARHLRSDF